MLHLSTIEESTYQTLKDIFQIDLIKNQFALAGGTSLALQIGHRVSIDLDIFSKEVFNVKELEILLADNKLLKYKYAGSNSRILFSFINNIKCDFVQEPAAILNPFYQKDKVSYYSIQDIATMKMHTICGRGKKRIFLIYMHCYKIFLGKKC
jgi:hypothetical protein